MTEKEPRSQDFSWHVTPDGPLFDYAPPEEQYEVTRWFMDLVRDYSGLTLSSMEVECHPFMDFDNRWQPLLDLQEPGSDKPVFYGEKLIALAIACYDDYLADNVRAYHGYLSPFTDKANEYFRAVPHHQNLPFLKPTAIDTNRTMLVGSPAHIRAHAIENGVERRCGLVTPDLGFVIYNKGTEPVPPISVPRQVILASLLRCGFNSLQDPFTDQDRVKGKFVAPAARELLPSGSEDQDISGIPLWIRGWHQPSLDERYQRCARFWGNLLGHQMSEQHKPASLFSSGTAANEAVMRVIADQAAGQPAFMHPYWYHENIPTAQKLFNMTQHIDEARVLLVNPEPVSYFQFEEEAISPAQTIGRFLLNAERNNKEKHYLVTDVTVDPFHTISPAFQPERYPNVELVKTMSVTKHQNGSRRYFFGAAWSPNDTLTSLIDQTKEAVGGEMNDYRIMHFPLSPNPFDEEDIHAVGDRQKEVAWKNKQLEVLSNDDTVWQPRAYSYFTFIFPPKQFIQTILEGMTGDETRDNKWIDERNQAILECIHKTIMMTKAMDLGQSFGLKHTRINPQGCLTTVGGVQFRLRIPRLCPGFASDVNQLKDATTLLLSYLDGL